MTGDAPDASEEVFWHGLDPETGGYLLPPRRWADLRDEVVASFRPEWAPKLEQDLEALTSGDDRRGEPPQGVDLTDLASAGWGVVFADGVDPRVRDALAPLLAHRESQAEERYFVFAGREGLSREQTADDWLSTKGLGPGVGDVDRVPYYLLVVGDPAILPFDAELDLAARYAVGRVAFDELDDYERYAWNVVEAERDPPRGEAKLTFFSQRHAGDKATRSSSRYLVGPLLKRLAEEDWPLEAFLVEEATKSRLGSLLGGDETPSVLLSVGHGLGAGPKGKLLDRVGALVCHDYPGPDVWGTRRMSPEHYFAAADVAPEADLRGLVAVFFGCYTAGMPEYDSFTLDTPQRLGPEAMLTPLARRLLGHERGALAVVGHVDRAWGHSYVWRGHSQPYTFESMLKALMEGQPVGAAARFLGDRSSDLARILGRQKLDLALGREVDRDHFLRCWIAEQDARSYLVVGDPAARPSVPWA